MAKILPVTRKRKPEYERLRETLDVLTDPELMRQIKKSEADFTAGTKGLSFQEVSGEPLIPRKRRKRG